MCMCVCVWVYVCVPCAYRCQRRPKEGIWSLESRVWSVWCRCWELDQVLCKSSKLLAAKPCLQLSSLPNKNNKKQTLKLLFISGWLPQCSECGGQRTTCGSWFFPPILWGPWDRTQAGRMAAGILTHWAISLTLSQCFRRLPALCIQSNSNIFSLSPIDGLRMLSHKDIWGYCC